MLGNGATATEAVAVAVADRELQGLLARSLQAAGFTVWDGQPPDADRPARPDAVVIDLAHSQRELPAHRAWVLGILERLPLPVTARVTPRPQLANTGRAYQPRLLLIEYSRHGAAIRRAVAAALVDGGTRS